MVSLRDKLKSTSLEEHVKANKRTVAAMWVFYILYFASASILITFRVIEENFQDYLNSNRPLFDVLLIVRCFLRLLLDAYITYQFTSSYKFLVNMKVEIQGELSSFNKRVIAATMTMLGVFIAIALISNICSTLYNMHYFNFSEDSEVLLLIMI